MPTSDPAFPIVSAILDVVPASRWKFARVAIDGDLRLVFASDENVKTLAMLSMSSSGSVRRLLLVPVSLRP
jgi:hypothetical protein